MGFVVEESSLPLKYVKFEALSPKRFLVDSRKPYQDIARVKIYKLKYNLKYTNRKTVKCNENAFIVCVMWY